MGCVSISIMAMFGLAWAPRLLHSGPAPPTSTDAKKSLLLLGFEPGLLGVSSTTLNASPHPWVLGRQSL